MNKLSTSLKSNYYSAKEWTKRAAPENQSLRLYGTIDPLRTKERIVNK
jgi:hypothetical protein